MGTESHYVCGAIGRVARSRSSLRRQNHGRSIRRGSQTGNAASSRRGSAPAARKVSAPILLCYLQGQTNEEAAALLHCPTGTLKIRLLRGPEMLRRCLIKRGLALSLTAFLGEALLDMAQAAVPQPLTRAAVQAATCSATPAVAALADGTLQSMCLAKLKVAALVLVTLALICLADGMLGHVVAEPDATIEHDTPVQPSPSSFSHVPMSQILSLEEPG